MPKKITAPRSGGQELECRHHSNDYRSENPVHRPNPTLFRTDRRLYQNHARVRVLPTLNWKISCVCPVLVTSNTWPGYSSVVPYKLPLGSITTPLPGYAMPLPKKSVICV